MNAIEGEERTSIKNKNVNMLALVVWGSLVASFPMCLLSLIVDGPASIVLSFHQLTRTSLVSLFYIAYVSTLIGYGAWNWLLSRNSVAVVVPFTLLVPVVGMVSSVLIFNEPTQTWKLIAALLMLSGLGINIMSSKFLTSRHRSILANDDAVVPNLNQ